MKTTTTTTEIEELIQLIRTLKISQLRKQLEADRKSRYQYMNYPSNEWMNRFQILEGFFSDAGRRKP